MVEDTVRAESPEGRRALRWAGRACLLAILAWAGLMSGALPGVGRLACGAFLLVGIPISVAALFWMGRRAAAGERSWLRGAKALLVLAWLPAAGLGFLWFALAQPWPLSMRQGPDTDHAREAFEAAVGFPPPPSVTELYGKREWAGPGEHVVSLSFRFEDEDVLERIVTQLRLEAAEDVGALSSFPAPSWWPSKEELARATSAYRWPNGGPQRFVHLWIDRERGLAWLQDVDVA